MPYHLPVLLNPLVNAVFNCPTPTTSPLKKLFNNVKGQRFILLVPSTDVLLQYQDLDSGLPLSELCYNYDFVASHILIQLQESKVTEQEYRTLNGNSVIIRSQAGIVMSKPELRKCRVKSYEVLRNFNDYLSNVIYFPLLHIDRPLVGALVRNDELQVFGSYEMHNPSKSKTINTISENHIPFEKFIRLYPQLGAQLDGYFQRDRQRIRNEVDQLDKLIKIFKDLVIDVYGVIKEDKNFRNYMELLNVTQEYVELNMYEDIWLKLVQLNGSKEPDRVSGYSSTKYISLNNVATILYPEGTNSFDLRVVTEVEKRVVKATDCFAKLSLTNSHNEKAKIVVSTFQILTTKMEYTSIDPTIDADTLIGLMLVVLCRSQVKNLKSHLEYLREFAPRPDDVKFGLTGYSLSTIEAVLAYFEAGDGTEKLKKLISLSEANRVFWDLIRSGVAVSLSSYKNSLISRSSNCESSLSICIHAGRLDLIKEILLNYQEQIKLEDLLFDVNQANSTLLIQALETGHDEIAELLIDVMISNCTNNEFYEYVNRSNSAGRTVAHYLPQAFSIIEKIGLYLDWRKKDVNMHTPLFIICRAYDQLHYSEMLSRSFEYVFEYCRRRGEDFSFTDHEDPMGNSLLHIMKGGIQSILSQPNINVNKSNIKGMTPLMLYAKYNRIENIRDILEDKRLIVSKIQNPQTLKAIDYVKNPMILNLIGTHIAKNSLYGLLSADGIKFEDNCWYLWITVKFSDNSYSTLRQSVKNIQGLLQFYNKKHPMNFLPIDHILSILKNIGKPGILPVINLENSIFLGLLTQLLSVIGQRNEYMAVLRYNESDLSTWLRTNNFKPRANKDERIEPEEVSSIQSFLKFNLSEFSEIKEKFTILRKLVVFQSLKAQDIECAQRIIYQQMEIVSNSVGPSVEKTFIGSNENYSLDSFQQAIEFIAMCLETLSSKIQYVLDSKVTLWWRLYGELSSLRREYQRNFPSDFKSSDVSGEESKGFFESYIEGKRQKTEDKLQARLRVCITKLQTLSGELKKDHENLAEEISFFVTFKNFAYESFVMKTYANICIKHHRNILQVIEEFRKYNSTKAKN
ncbi:uncharacterized protein Ecym_3024 [Eremothecium cymbalariae DBVPG|uniref:VPS9 domain-containing protein n=1 Tax=Eremothecium cymbalariae (strain CBS 270.75 / DBVPG 7215 / KCTC 17166 / NRRL Y-17582) TaxID=931890 RepID=G8JQX1_ERECY|nr:Hypothetical protein Ecym_3024 [Eremothecium cymbalariae DBVPG\